MELNKLATRALHEQGVEVRIKCPSTGEETDFYIKIIGPDSKEWRKYDKAELRGLIERQGKEFTAEELLEREIAKIESITIGWRGLTDDGKEVPFTKKACRKLYEDAPHVMDQVDVFAGKKVNFTKA